VPGAYSIHWSVITVNYGIEFFSKQFLSNRQNTYQIARDNLIIALRIPFDFDGILLARRRLGVHLGVPVHDQSILEQTVFGSIGHDVVVEPQFRLRFHRLFVRSHRSFVGGRTARVRDEENANVHDDEFDSARQIQKKLLRRASNPKKLLRHGAALNV